MPCSFEIFVNIVIINYYCVFDMHIVRSLLRCVLVQRHTAKIEVMPNYQEKLHNVAIFCVVIQNFLTDRICR